MPSRLGAQSALCSDSLSAAEILSVRLRITAIVATGIGPDGLPAVFEGGGWVSHDRRYRWNGTTWTPLKQTSVAGPWFMRAGVVVLFLAVAGYAVYTIVVNQEEYTVGYFVGVVVYFALLFVIFRACDRWGCFGAAIRTAAIALALLRILALLRHPLPG